MIMLKWLMRRWIAAFERAYDYDMDYVRDMLEVSPRAVRVFGRIGALGQYRRDVPIEAYFAAKLVAARWEDCGPCTQLCVTMAERAGVAPALLRAVLARDEPAMTDATRLGFRFAEAVLAHEPQADALREEIVARWGRHAVISLSFGIAAARVFPTVKYGLGHGKACTRITVAGAVVPVLREAA
jgi:alkylhydroperoxidase family enzyme